MPVSSRALHTLGRAFVLLALVVQACGPATGDFGVQRGTEDVPLASTAHTLGRPTGVSVSTAPRRLSRAQDVRHALSEHRSPRSPRAVPASSRGDRIVATVDGEPIYASDVEAHLRPPRPRVGSLPPTDPRHSAVVEAVRVRLFLREAERRGLMVADGPREIVQSRLVQALIRQELMDHRISASQISNAEAKQYYNRNRDVFSTTERVVLDAVVVKKADLAERILQQSNDIGAREFRKLVRTYSVHSISGSRDGHLMDGHFMVVDEAVEHAPGGTPHSDPLEAEIHPVALRMQYAGQVGSARDARGYHYVLRAAEVEKSIKTWSKAFLPAVKNVMLEERREKVLEGLYQRLRRGTDISIHKNALEGIAVPESKGN